MSDARSSGERPSGGWQALRRHPVLAALLLGLPLAGALLGALYLEPDWSLLRRAVAGGAVGFGAALMVTVTRLFG